MTSENIPQLIRNRALVDHPTCTNCNGGGLLDLHHMDGNCSNHDPANLLVLCRSCHGRLHHKQRRDNPATYLCRQCGSEFTSPASAGAWYCQTCRKLRKRESQRRSRKRYRQNL